MSSAPSAERRKHPRRPLKTGVQFYHDLSRRRVPGRCEDISQGGMKMYIPATTPIRAGDSIRISLGAPARPEFSVLGEAPISASVVRVDRSSLLSAGYLAVGVRFM